RRAPSAGSVSAGRVADVEGLHPSVVHVGEQARIRPARAELIRALDEPPARGPEAPLGRVERRVRIEVLQPPLTVPDGQVPVRLPLRALRPSVREEAELAPARVVPAQVVEEDAEPVLRPADRARLPVPDLRGGLSESVHGTAERPVLLHREGPHPPVASDREHRRGGGRSQHERGDESNGCGDQLQGLPLGSTRSKPTRARTPQRTMVTGPSLTPTRGTAGGSPQGRRTRSQSCFLGFRSISFASSSVTSTSSQVWPYLSVP